MDGTGHFQHGPFQGDVFQNVMLYLYNNFYDFTPKERFLLLKH